MKLVGTYEYDQAFAETLATELNTAYSDKASSHNYHVVYAHVLNGKTINNFLEIGLFLNELQHTDLTAWARVYPEANIYGADIKRDQLFDRDNIRMTYVDQSDSASFAALKDKFPVEFDVILDDAKHMHGPTINTFENLFPVLKSNGVYMIEDCLGDNPNNNGWQQTVAGLTQYLESNGYTYEVFQSRAPENVVDPETQEPTDEYASSDDYIICVYKA